MKNLKKAAPREFFQWNIDLIGVNSPEADAELVAICAELFQIGWIDFKRSQDPGE